MVPIVSVILVSDFAAGQVHSWNDIRSALIALRGQDFDEAAEFILVESAEFAHQIPADLMDIIPTLKILFTPASTAFQLKNKGVSSASADIVAFLDADCTPDSDWLRHLVTTLQRHPHAVAVSGRTTYPGRTLLKRILSLTSRSYLNRFATGNTGSISHNNAAFRRQILLQNPLPSEFGPFFGKLHARQIIQAGHQVLFTPSVRVVHNHEGWETEIDVRRNVGYATIAMRRMDPQIPHAWMARLSYFSIPLFFFSRLLLTWWLSLLFFRQFSVSWYHLPLAFCTSVAIHILEIPGMICAVRGQRPTITAFR